jgi:hypothetical protein
MEGWIHGEVAAKGQVNGDDYTVNQMDDRVQMVCEKAYWEIC